MARGGARPGAGRPKGAATRKTAEIANQAAEQGITPLEVMLASMRALWDEATDDAGAVIDPAKAKEATAVAKDAAPYIHPRLQAVNHSGPDGGPLMLRWQSEDEARTGASS